MSDPRPAAAEVGAASPRDRLGAALRDLADRSTRVHLSDADAEQLLVQLEDLNQWLAAAPARTEDQDSPHHHFALVGGTAHPVAPQLRLDRDASGVSGTVRLGRVFEGGPGLVHGGILALLFDHAMGAAVFADGHAAMTRTLDVEYVAPTAIDETLRVSARVERVEGRRIFVSGQIVPIGAGSTVTARAEAVFIALTAGNVARIFGRDGADQQ